MNAKKVGQATCVLLIGAALAGCSSTASSPQAVSQPTSATSPSAPVDTATTSPASTTTATQAETPSTQAPTTSVSSKASVSGLLAKWGTGGKISTKAMPTADPAWIARLQPGMDNTYVDLTIDSKTLNLVALVDEAAREGDIPALIRLSNGAETSKELSQPGLLTGLVTLLEKTHPADTDGITYPGFSLTGGPSGSKFDTEDAAAVGLAPGAKYKGVTTYFRSATGPGADGTTDWTGAHFAS